MELSANPIETTGRIIIIDVLRGFALFGVLVANLSGFVNFTLPDQIAETLTNTRADKITSVIIALFFDNKFITLFSLLFGYGFGVMMQNIERKGIRPNPFFLRRMFILLVIGMIHIGIWWGEILSTYALCGMLLLLFRKVRNKNLLLFGFLFILLGTTLIRAVKMYTQPAHDPQMDGLLNSYFELTLNKNVSDIFKINYTMAYHVFIMRLSEFTDAFEILGKFLLGLWVLRRGILQNITLFIPFIKKMQIICMVLGLLYLGDRVLVEVLEYSIDPIPLKLLEYMFTKVGILALSLFYATSIILLFQRKPGIKIFSFFQAVGTMSLTNYLTHTLFFVIIYYGVGFGMLGKLHLYTVFPIAVIIYGLQIVFCKAWLNKYRYGPVEWIWRQFTYGKRLKLRKV